MPETLSTELEPTTSSQAIDSNNALTWPEDSPSISMSTKLGKNKRHYSVDVAELHRLLDKAGVDEGRSALSIDVQPRIDHGFTGGHYSIKEQKAHVATKGFWGIHLRESTINNALLHELGHHFQYTTPRKLGSLALHGAYELGHSAFEREARRFAKKHKDFHILHTTKIKGHENKP